MLPSILIQPVHIHFVIIITAVNKGRNGLGSKFVSTFIFCYILTEVFVMNNVDEVLQVISIGLIVAGFLLNTRRFLNAIELCKECLLILKDGAGMIDENLTKSFYKRIYFTMWKACRLISDNTNAIKYGELMVKMYRENGERLAECMLSINLAEMYCHQSKFARAEELSDKALLNSKEIGNRIAEARCYENLGTVYRSVGKYEKAREHLEKSLAIQKEIGNRNREAFCLASLGTVHRSVGEYEKAKEHLEKSLAIQKEIGDRNGEATSYLNLGAMYQSVGEYTRAREHLEKSLAVQKETGDRNGEATSYVNLGNAYRSVGEYEKAKEHLEKSLAIQEEIGDRNGEATCYLSLGAMYRSVGEYESSTKCLEKSITISEEIGDRHTQALSYLDLGATYCSLRNYRKAKECNEKGLVILIEIGDKEGEAKFYISQGNVEAAVCNTIEAKKCFEKALAISREIGNGEIEATSYFGLARLLTDYPEDIRAEQYKKAREHLEKSLKIDKEIGDRHGEATRYAKIGDTYQSASQYEKAKEHIEKSIAIQREVGHRQGEATSYLNLATVYRSVGEYEKAQDYCFKSEAISRRIGDRQTIALSYLELGAVYCNLFNFRKANECNKKAFVIFTEIGHRKGIANFYINQGTIQVAVGAHFRGKEYFEKALNVSKELRNDTLEAAACLHLGRLFLRLAKYDQAEEYINKALASNEAIADISGQFNSLEMMGQLRMSEGKIQEAISNFLSAIKKCEKIRDSLFHNETFKISFFERSVRCYRVLIKLLWETGNPTKALYASELSRARALADLLSARYCVENQISSNPRTWTGLESIVAKGCNQTLLYVSYCSKWIYLWILKASGVVHYQGIHRGDIALEQSSKRFDAFFEFRYRDESEANLRLKMNLSIFYKLIIAPVMDFLKGPEIIIVPDRVLYQIPFAALTDECGKYLSETLRIRIVPSLTTLKLINESPADYHCQTGALLVGNPDVGEVIFYGRRVHITRVPYAEKEVRMVGEKLGVEPLLGEQATKQAVLQAMNSVALIHIAAHGDAESGGIALVPSFRPYNEIPPEDLYLLTMSDISKVHLRAKLVVLSCCHSARGEAKAEGAVGIARAFLGSGARSVLVSLWALEDQTTMQLMSHFYDHLFAGKSAGESLHEAMKWMRNEGYDVSQWAPFMLIGDDVTFDFRKIGKIHRKQVLTFFSVKGLLVFNHYFF